MGEPSWTPEGDLHFSLTLSHEGEDYVEPLKALGAVLGVSLSFAQEAEVIRTACYLE